MNEKNVPPLKELTRSVVFYALLNESEGWMAREFWKRKLLRSVKVSLCIYQGSIHIISVCHM
jgi:hypothetical protein